MCMHVCIHTSAHECVCVCMYMCMHVCESMHAHLSNPSTSQIFSVLVYYLTQIPYTPCNHIYLLDPQIPQTPSFPFGFTGFPPWHHPGKLAAPPTSCPDHYHTYLAEVRKPMGEKEEALSISSLQGEKMGPRDCKQCCPRQRPRPACAAPGPLPQLIGPGRSSLAPIRPPARFHGHSSAGLAVVTHIMTKMPPSLSPVISTFL